MRRRPDYRVVVFSREIVRSVSVVLCSGRERGSHRATQSKVDRERETDCECSLEASSHSHSQPATSRS